MINKGEVVRSFTVCFIVFFLFLILTGTLTSGYHFTDDHEIIRIQRDLTSDNLSLQQTINKWVIDDLEIRFRPVYYIHRVVETYLFGEDMKLWSIYNGILGALSAWLLYLVARNLKYSRGLASIFSMFALIGNQMSIWWRLGPAETIGSFLFIASFWFLVIGSVSTKHRLIYSVSYMICLLFSSLCKESFALAIPSIIFFKIYLEYKKKQVKLKTLANQNIGFIFGGLMIFLVEIIIIIFFIGTNKIGYAGIDPVMSINNTMVMIKEFIKTSMFFICIYIIIPTSILTVTIMVYLEKLGFNHLKVYLKKISISICILVLFLGPQMILYFKSGMYERYLLPTTIGISLFTIYLLKQVQNKFRYVYSAGIILVGILIGLNFLKVISKAISFTQEGHNTNAMISSIIEGSKPEEKILVVTKPIQYYEWNYSLDNYLKNKCKGKVVFDVVEEEIYSESDLILKYKWDEWISNKTILVNDSYQQPNKIVFFDEDIERQYRMKKSNAIAFDNYIEENFGPFSVYIHK